MWSPQLRCWKHGLVESNVRVHETAPRLKCAVFWYCIFECANFLFWVWKGMTETSDRFKKCCFRKCKSVIQCRLHGSWTLRDISQFLSDNRLDGDSKVDKLNINKRRVHTVNKSFQTAKQNHVCVSEQCKTVSKDVDLYSLQYPEQIFYVNKPAVEE